MCRKLIEKWDYWMCGVVSVCNLYICKSSDVCKRNDGFGGNWLIYL